MEISKQLPQAIEFEKAVLGAIMLEPDSLQTVLEIIKTPDCFYQDSHRRIYNAILKMYNQGTTIDLIMVCEELKKTSELELVGGFYEVTLLTENVVSSANIDRDARVIVEKYLLRETIRLSGEAISKAYDSDADPFDLLNEISVNYQELEAVKNGNGIIHAFEAGIEAIEEMEERAKSNSDLIGDSTGINALDEITGGTCSPDFVAIGAGTGEGKTTLALNLAQNFANNGVPTVYFSLEMNPKQLIYKCFAAEIGKPLKYVKRGRITDQEKEVLIKFLTILKTKNLYFNSKSGISVIEMRSVIRGLVRKHGVKKVFIDYLQLVSGGDSRRFGTQEVELAYISRQLKECALELDINVFALSQVTIEKGAKRLYTPSDLRSSKAIGHDADQIWFVFRPIMHDIQELKIDGSIKLFNRKDALIQISKFRGGETGIVEVDFDGICQKFTDKVEDYKGVNPF